MYRQSPPPTAFNCPIKTEGGATYLGVRPGYDLGTTQMRTRYDLGANKIRTGYDLGANWVRTMNCTAPEPGCRPGGVLEAKNVSIQSPRFGFLMSYCVQDRREVGQAALETALSDLKYAFLFYLWPFFRAPPPPSGGSIIQLAQTAHTPRRRLSASARSPAEARSASCITRMARGEVAIVVVASFFAGQILYDIVSLRAHFAYWPYKGNPD